MGQNELFQIKLKQKIKSSRPNHVGQFELIRTGYIKQTWSKKNWWAQVY